MRQRVIAVALRFQGYHYQHHHVPDWDPPADWPYKESPLGKQSKGVDCSNFTSFASAAKWCRNAPPPASDSRLRVRAEVFVARDAARVVGLPKLVNSES